MTYTPDFSGVWAKIARAKEHIEALQGEISTGRPPTVFNAIHRIPVRLEHEPDTGHHVFRTTAAPPEDVIRRWGVITGDAVHNLRSALDHLFWQLALVTSNGKVPWTYRQIKEVQFPITDTPKLFKGSATLKYIGPRHRAIIKDHQPHGSQFNFGYGGIHPFSRLQKLSNLDKHRLVIETLARPDNFIAYTEAIFGDAGGEIVESHTGAGMGGPLVRDAEIMRMKVRPANAQLNMEMAGYIAVRPSFQDILPGITYSSPVDSELLNITAQTLQLVEEIEHVS
jgi:hypothetical protein